MSSATVTIDAECVSPSRSLAALARISPSLVVVTSRMFGELERELGDAEAVARHMVRAATNTGRPIAVNLATNDGSRTVLVPPKGWSEERLAGWAAGHHEALEAAFGPGTPMRPEAL